MSALIGPIVSLASQICQLINTEETLKYVNQLKDHQDQLIAEDAKGDDADDGKIEALHKEIAVIIQAINNQYATFKAQSGGGAPAVAAAQ